MIKQLNVKINNMSDYKSRLLDEAMQLTEKIEKLESFINSETILTLPAVQHSLLNVQYLAMKTYRQCLYERIDALN
jgi:hypothetical protein